MHELLIQIVFYIAAAVAVGSALMVITQNNPVRCVLFLVLTFFSSAVLWILTQAEFLALILILVYVGAVMTLFLFVVMMLNIDVESMKKHFTRYLPFGLVFVALFTSLFIMSLPKTSFNSPVQLESAVSQTNYIQQGDEVIPEPAVSNTEALGLVLYTDYFLAFEIAALLLLVAIISAVTLVHRNIVRSRRQNIRHQIMTSRDDRVTLINMQSEK